MSGSFHSLGEYVVAPAGLAPTVATAGGSNAATDLLTPAIDRTLYGNPQSCVLDCNITAAVASGKTCTVTVRLTHSDASGSGYTDFNNTAGGYSANNPTPPTNAGEQTLVIAAQSAGPNHAMAFYNLAGAKRYLKAVVNSAFTAANTDTDTVALSVIFGGIDDLLAAQPANA